MPLFLAADYAPEALTDERDMLHLTQNRPIKA